MRVPAGRVVGVPIGVRSCLVGSVAALGHFRQGEATPALALFRRVEAAPWDAPGHRRGSPVTGVWGRGCQDGCWARRSTYAGRACSCGVPSCAAMAAWSSPSPGPPPPAAPQRRIRVAGQRCPQPNHPRAPESLGGQHRGRRSLTPKLSRHRRRSPRSRSPPTTVQPWSGRGCWRGRRVGRQGRGRQGPYLWAGLGGGGWPAVLGGY